MISIGCKKIAHVAGFKHTRIYNNRIRGFIDALLENNLNLNNDFILECGLTIDDGYKMMQQLIALNKPLDAVYFASDYAALGGFQYLQEIGIKVPKDIAIIGFGNEPFTSLINPTISTMNQHSEQIGKLAANTFLNLIKADNFTYDLRKQILKATLIIRESSMRI